MGIEDDDPNSHCVGESAVAVCFKDNRLFVANDNHAVQAYTFPAFDKDGIITRFTAPVTQIMSGLKIEVRSFNLRTKLAFSVFMVIVIKSLRIAGVSTQFSYNNNINS